MTNAPRQVAVIAAHPDDEVLGCGGTIRRHVLAGDKVTVIALADGETARTENADGRTLPKREAAARVAAKILGVEKSVFCRFPDNRLDTVPILDIIQAVERELESIKPEIVYTHHVGDLNVDHRRAHEVAVTVCRPMPSQTVRTLLFFETPSSTEWQTFASAPAFLPNWFVDISETFDTKMQALQAYADEIREWPHARSWKALEHFARWRGSSVGCAAAEAFMLGRHIR